MVPLWSVVCTLRIQRKLFGLPSIGRLTHYVEPLHIPQVRCDSGVREGSEISIYYDPLICKLVTNGKSRDEALRVMRDALDHYVIRGVINNIPLLRDIVTEKRFKSGNITTKYLPETYPDGFKGVILSERETAQLAAIAAALYARHKARAVEFKNQPVSSTTSALMSGNETALSVTVPHLDDRKKSEHRVVAHSQSGNLVKITVDGVEYSVRGDLNLAKRCLSVVVGDEELVVQPIKLEMAGRLTLQYKGSWFHLKVIPELAGEYQKYMHEKPQADMTKLVVAPMPGLIKSVAVTAGQEVIEGQELCVIEAMKMQNSLTAGRTGKVKAVMVKAGQTVDAEETLVELE